MNGPKKPRPVDPYDDLPNEDDPYADIPEERTPIMDRVGAPTLPAMGRSETNAPYRNTAEARTAHQVVQRDNLKDLGGMAAAAVEGVVPFGLAQTDPIIKRGTEYLRKRAPDVAKGTELAASLYGATKMFKAIPQGATALKRIASNTAGGALANAVYGSGAREGTLGERVAGGAKDAAIGAVGGAVISGGIEAARVSPKLLRVLGITTQRGRDAAAEKAIQTAIERSGQSMDDVTARAEAFLAEHGRPATLAEAIGDDASERALGAMRPLGDKAASRASSVAAEVGEDTPIGRALLQASRKTQSQIAPPTSLMNVPFKAGAVGLRHAGRRESETLLEALTKSRMDVPQGSGGWPVGPVDPLPPLRPRGPTPMNRDFPPGELLPQEGSTLDRTPASGPLDRIPFNDRPPLPAPAPKPTRGKRPNLTILPRTESAGTGSITFRSGPGTSSALRSVDDEPSIVLQELAKRKPQRGATKGQLEWRQKQFGPKVAPETPVEPVVESKPIKGKGTREALDAEARRFGDDPDMIRGMSDDEYVAWKKDQFGAPDERADYGKFLKKHGQTSEVRRGTSDDLTRNPEAMAKKAELQAQADALPEDAPETMRDAIYKQWKALKDEYGRIGPSKGNLVGITESGAPNAYADVVDVETGKLVKRFKSRDALDRWIETTQTAPEPSVMGAYRVGGKSGKAAAKMLGATAATSGGLLTASLAAKQLKDRQKAKNR